MIYTYDSILGFGKHKGKTTRWLLDNNPNYLAWCCDEVEGFELSEDEDEELEQIIWDIDDTYFEAYGY